MIYLLNGLPAFAGTFIVTGNIIISGQGLFADGTAAAPSISFLSDTDTGVFRSAANEIGVSLGGVAGFRFQASGYFIGATVSNGVRFASGGAVDIFAAGTNQHITLTPSGTGYVGASNVILATGYNAPSSGAGAAMFYSGGEAFFRGRDFGTSLFIPCVIDGLTTRINAASGGPVLIGTSVNSGALLQIGTNTTNSAGGMVFGTDTFLYRSAAGTLTLNGDFKVGAGNKFEFVGRSQIVSVSDGTLRLANNAGTDFTRLQFGGTTASFPAIKKSGSAFVFTLADDSADTHVVAAGIRMTAAAGSTSVGVVSLGNAVQTTVGAAGGASALPATPTGFLKFKIGSTDYVLPYYAA